MKMDKILETIKNLARSQGSYGRMYNDLMAIQEDNPEKYEEIVDELERQNFADAVALVMYLEA